jgi:hypothetical protein
MSDPFSGTPDPGMPRPTRRRFEPGLIEQALRALRETLRPALQKTQHGLRQAWQLSGEALQRTKRLSKSAFQRAERYGAHLWHHRKGSPRTLGLIGAAVALTLAGAYTLSATMDGRSMCPPAIAGKPPKFLVLMDTVAHASAGSDLDLRYDVCGLASGTPYRGKVRFAAQRSPGKKRPKPVVQVVSFKDQVEGVATRRRQLLSLASTKPGTYTLELSVADNKGRERKQVQKVVVR